MDDQINSYIESLVLEVLASPNFIGLSPEERQKKGDQLREHISSVVLDTLIDSLNEDQLKSLEGLTPANPEMEAKIEEYASQIPFFSSKLEEVLRSEIDKIKENPQLLTQNSPD